MSPQSALELAAGPLLVTLCLAFILFGIFTAQIYYYYTNYEMDGIKLKAFIGSLWILEIFHTALCLQVLYDYLITNYGDPVNGVGKIIWSVPLTVMIELLIVTMTSAFYVRRIWHMSEKNPLAVAAPIILLVARDAMSIVTLSLLYKYSTWTAFRGHPEADRIVETTFALGLIADVTITSTLVWFLGWNRTNWSRTSGSIQQLMHYTVSTGALTVICSAVIVGTVKISGSLLFGGLIEFISKLYANSMLAMLNARNKIRENNAPADRSDAYEFSTTFRTGPYSVEDSRIRSRGTNSSAYGSSEPSTAVDHTIDALGFRKSMSTVEESLSPATPV
ncbi:hypothetical protein BDW22DRAFT_1428975 [Trametopsis cervina]|nr:hypothetical protein BDW22DRAFT_1428975 [Trametopsis cervina]